MPTSFVTNLFSVNWPDGVCFPLEPDNNETERKLTCFVVEQKGDKVSVFQSFLLKCEHTLTPSLPCFPWSAPAVKGISFQKQSHYTTSFTMLLWKTILKPVSFHKATMTKAFCFWETSSLELCNLFCSEEGKILGGKERRGGKDEWTHNRCSARDWFLNASHRTHQCRGWDKQQPKYSGIGHCKDLREPGEHKAILVWCEYFCVTFLKQLPLVVLRFIYSALFAP